MTEVQRKIKEEITNDPLGIGYATMTDAEVVTSLKNPVYGQAVNVTLSKALLVKVFGLDRAATIIQTLRTNAANGDAKAELALELISTGVDLNDPVTQSAIDSFVTNGVITSAEGVTLKSAGTKKISRLEQLGITTDVPVTWITDLRKV